MPPHAHEARIGGATVPKELVKSLAEPSIHRPQELVPAHGSEQDFRRQAQVRVQRRSTASTYRP